MAPNGSSVMARRLRTTLGFTSEQAFTQHLSPAARTRKVPTLADGIGAGSELIEDFLGALVNGRHNPGRHSIKSRAEMFVSV
jgi:hypothetical protein